jgi:protein TonB
MRTYAPVPTFVDHKRHPRALLLIVVGHAALLAAVMSAKMDLPRSFVPTITTIDLIDEQKPPPEDPPPPQPNLAHDSVIDHPAIGLPLQRPDRMQVDTRQLPVIDTGPAIDPGPTLGIPRPAEPVRAGPRFVTPDYDIKPPYPQSKLRSEEEAVLRLKLSIDERGRVTAVDPVGAADPVFLAAARRHLLARWRYRPATVDGRPVATSTVVTLRFQLDD